MALTSEYVLIASDDLDNFALRINEVMHDGALLVGSHLVTYVPGGVEGRNLLYSQAVVFNGRKAKSETAEKPLADLPDSWR